MRIRYKPTDWHKHFCLFPIELNGAFVWLEYVERRLLWSAWDHAEYEYRELEK